MSINLSDLTSPNNQDVLAEITSGADFLDPIGKLKNLSRSPNSGSDALQTVALNQPKALPYDGKGYLYLSGVSGNYADVPVFDMGALDDFTIQIDGLDAGSVRPAATVTPISYFGAANTNRSFILQISTTGQIKLYLYLNGVTGHTYNDSTAVPTNTIGIKVTRVGTLLTYWVDTGSGYVSHETDTVPTTPLYNPADIVSVNIGQYSGGDRLIGKIGRAVIWNNGTQAGSPVLDVDFTATNVRHGDTKIKCATGQVVTINTAGVDPAKIIKRSVLRFDGVNDGLNGLFANNIDSGYMFAAFSVLGDGGSAWGRVFTTNLVGSGTDYSGAGAGFSLRNSNTTELMTIVQGLTQSQTGMFDDSNGDILHEVKLEGSDFSSKVNNAGFISATHSNTIDSDRFNIGQDFITTQNSAIDLEFLALFSAESVPDEATASKVRDYINKRNNVFSLVDNSYYFFDPQKATFTGNFTGANTLDGYITGSDNGDTDVRSNLTLKQPTLNDRPSTDGYTITFNDTAEHLVFGASASQTLSGWQVVGSSLGTFAYRVQGAVTELNLLGNKGVIRTTGELYGIILLPDSATGADIESARRLLIDRGAADGTSSSAAANDWYGRNDIVEFKHLNTSSLTDLRSSFRDCLNLSVFPALDLSNVDDFSSAWRNTTALLSFPSGAKLGTAANNVNFSDAWRSSGLTSFSTPLPTATTLGSAFRYCYSLSSFNLDEIPLATHINTAFQGNVITSFNTKLPKVKYAYAAWYACTALTDFSADVFTNWNPSSISTGVFNDTWGGCTSLTAQSVENILTSIDASGHYATTNKVSGGPALADAGIDIDYDGTTLSAATNSAVTSLKAKGWSIIVNNVTL